MKVYIIIEKHDSYQNFDYGKPLKMFRSKKKAKKYKKKWREYSYIIVEKKVD